MEQTNDKNQSHAKEVWDLNTRVCLLEDNDKVQDNRLTAHGKQLDSIILENQKQNSNQELMKKDLEFIKRSTEKTEDKLDQLIVKPVENVDKVKSVIVGLVIGFIFSIVVGVLFPHLGGIK